MPLIDIETALEELKQEMERVSAASDQLEQAGTSIHKLGEILEGKVPQIAELADKYVQEVTEKGSSAISDMALQGKEWMSTVKTQTEATLDKAQEFVKDAQNSVGLLEERLQKTIDVIDKVDFPSRLDKVDNQISSINIGLQNVQSELKRLEQRTLEKIDAQSSKQLSEIKLLGSRIEDEVKAVRKTTITQLVILAIIAIIPSVLILLIHFGIM